MENNKAFAFLEKYLMGPMGKMSQWRIVRGVMAAGMASIPFTIVGSMFLVLNILPDTMEFLRGFFEATFFKVSSLYMVANTATMGILALYFCIVFAYEYTKIHHDEEKVDVNPLTGALLAMFAFFMCIPELIFKDGTMTLLQIVDEKNGAFTINGVTMGNTISRLGSTGIFTGIIVGIIAVKIYVFCVKRNIIVKMPDTVPAGVSRSFTALIPTFFIAFAMILIEGILVFFQTDVFKLVAIPFGFVVNLTNTWIGIMLIYFIIHALWIVGIHGANIVTGLLTPIVLSNMEANQAGAHIPFAGEFQNSFVLMGGSGSTLGLVIFIAFFAKSAQLGALGKAALVPSFFNINEPIIFGLPVVYNPFVAIPFFLAPMTAATIGYFAIKLQMIAPPIAQVPWPTPIGIGAFIGSGGDWKALVVSFICGIAAFLVYFPFIKFYDNKLYKEEQAAA